MREKNKEHKDTAENPGKDWGASEAYRKSALDAAGKPHLETTAESFRKEKILAQQRIGEWTDFGREDGESLTAKHPKNWTR